MPDKGRDKSGGATVTILGELNMGARGKIREFFIANVGKVLTTQRIRKAGGINEYARCIRELRDEEGSQIKSHVDRAAKLFAPTALA